MKTTKIIFLGLSLCILNQSSRAQSPAGLDNYILGKMQELDIPGLSVAYIENGKIAWTKGYGYADIDKDIPFTPNTINAEIASVSKMVTSTAVLKLWEQGYFQLDDNINTYLPFAVVNPNYPNSPITFRMLLSHTSSLVQDNDGIPWDFEVMFYTPPSASESLGSFMQKMYTPGAAYYRDGANFSNVPPGSTYAYSNWGFSLLGYLVERISGTPFNQYCTQHIFAPLCMNQTGWFFSEVDTNITSRPYHLDTNKNRFVDYGLYEYPDYPDGQIKTSAVDLSRFLLMFMNYGILDGARILDSTTIALMRIRAVTTYLGDEWQGYTNQGCEEYFHVPDSHDWFGKYGGDNGISTGMWTNVTNNTGIIVLANGESFIGEILVHVADTLAAISLNTSQPLLNCAYNFNPCQHDITSWKNNPSQWALNSVPMKIGTKHYYTKIQTLDVLNLPVNGDASILLGKALIAAKLNMAQGSELSPIILTINAAMNLIGAKRLPFNVPIPFTSPTGIQMLALAASLNSYNSGTLNTTVCSGSSLREAGDAFNAIVPDAVVSVFPNPVSNSTTISFSLSHAQSVTLRIIDVNGRLVTTLADKGFEAGNNQILWNAADVNAGIYFLQFQSSENMWTEKLFVTKTN